MNRLVHSGMGFLRALQISNSNFFAFVEGGLDRPFYDRLLAQTFSVSSIKYEVIAAKELQSGTGGKVSVLNQFRSMRSSQSLSAEAFGKKFVCAFFVDKDIDDITRTQARSPHVIYTPTYDIEGHLFDCGDLHRAIADACGMTRNQAIVSIGNQKNWIDQCVTNWKDWTVLCVISQVRGVNCGCTFGRGSTINPDHTKPADKTMLGNFKTQMRRGLNLSVPEFDKLFSLYDRRMTKSIQANTPLRYFKGKWLKTLLEQHLRQVGAPPDANVNAAGERVTSTLVAQVGLSQNCIFLNQYSRAVSALVTHLT